jgi:hypothetical protein
MVTRRRRMVLYPQGYPDLAIERQYCDALAHFCGGDLLRTFDLARPTLNDTLRYASKIGAFHSAHHGALCVLRNAAQLHELLTLRGAFEDVLPITRTAAWTLFWNPVRDPDFPSTARREGQLFGDFTSGAVWRHDSGMEFLVLCPQLLKVEDLADRVELLTIPRSSAVRRNSMVQSALGIELRVQAAAG